MGRHLRRRDKKYRPKHVHIPVMHDTVKDFMFDVHGSLAAMRLAPNPAAFRQLSSCLGAISVALKSNGRENAILESGLRALADVGERYFRIDVLALGRLELPAIENAVAEAEQLITMLDVVSLRNAFHTLRQARPQTVLEVSHA